MELERSLRNPVAAETIPSTTQRCLDPPPFGNEIGAGDRFFKLLADAGAILVRLCSLTSVHGLTLTFDFSRSQPWLSRLCGRPCLGWFAIQSEDAVFAQFRAACSVLKLNFVGAPRGQCILTSQPRTPGSITISAVALRICRNNSVLLTRAS